VAILAGVGVALYHGDMTPAIFLGLLGAAVIVISILFWMRLMGWIGR
jgi:hypothetical protein